MKFGNIVRVTMIALGIMSAALIARDGFNIRLTEYLDAIVTAYDDTLKQIAVMLFEPSIQAIFEKLHEWLNWHLRLYPHWKHVFTLLWLFYGSISRTLVKGAIEEPDVISPAPVLLLYLWSGFVATVYGVALGTLPVSSDNIFPLAIATFFVWALGCALGGVFIAVLTEEIEGTWTERTWPDFFGVLFLLSILAVLAISFHVLAAGPHTSNLSWLQVTESPGLASLVATIALVGLFIVIGGVWLGISEKRFDNPFLDAGINILSVLGGAATIVYLSYLLA